MACACPTKLKLKDFSTSNSESPARRRTLKYPFTSVPNGFMERLFVRSTLRLAAVHLQRPRIVPVAIRWSSSQPEVASPRSLVKELRDRGLAESITGWVSCGLPNHRCCVVTWKYGSPIDRKASSALSWTRNQWWCTPVLIPPQARSMSAIYSH